MFQTVFGEIVPMRSNTDVITLSRFIVTRLLGNPDIAQKYAHPTVPHLYRGGKLFNSLILKGTMLSIMYALMI